MVVVVDFVDGDTWNKSPFFTRFFFVVELGDHLEHNGSSHTHTRGCKSHSQNTHSHKDGRLVGAGCWVATESNYLKLEREFEEVESKQCVLWALKF